MSSWLTRRRAKRTPSWFCGVCNLEITSIGGMLPESGRHLRSENHGHTRSRGASPFAASSPPTPHGRAKDTARRLQPPGSPLPQRARSGSELLGDVSDLSANPPGLRDALGVQPFASPFALPSPPKSSHNATSVAPRSSSHDRQRSVFLFLYLCLILVVQRTPPTRPGSTLRCLRGARTLLLDLDEVGSYGYDLTQT